MRYLGIDFGLKRVGISVSDEHGRFAFPKVVLPYSKAIAHKIEEICKVEEILNIVIGESIDYGGRENDVMEHVRGLKLELEEKGFTVVLEQEFGSSIEANRFQGKNEMHDASAAAIILQRYLERNSNE